MSEPAANGNSYDAVVIGAGVNGLTAAAMLGRAGRKVLVIERRSVVGGLAAGEEFHPGYRTCGLLHDTTGLLPEVVKALDLEAQGLRRSKRPPSVLAVASADTGLLLHHDPDEAAPEIVQYGSHDVDAYSAYRKFIERTRGFVRRLLASPPPELLNGSPSFAELAADGLALRRLGKRDMMELLRTGPMSLRDWLTEQFDTELLQCGLAVPALHGTFGGPFSPGTAGTALRYEALASGAVEGGPQGLVDALTNAVEACGASVRTSQTVHEILVKDDCAVGVVCEGGEEIRANLVLSSCDPKQTFLELLRSSRLPVSFVQEIQAYRMRGLAAKMHLALDKPLRFTCRPDAPIEFARTGRSLTDLERAFDAAKYRRFIDAPALDVHVPTVSRPDLAPPAHSVVSILIHGVPFDVEGGWNSAVREALGEVVVETLSAVTDGLDDSIVAREVLSPAEIEERYGVTGGHIYHGEHGLDQLMVRPARACARYATPIEGLYLCGSGSHPGGGITAAPGYLGAKAILGRRG